MKLRFLLVFLVSVAAIFTILNSRFFIASAQWSLGLDQISSVEPVVSSPPVYPFPPLNPDKQKIYTFPTNSSPQPTQGNALIPIQPVIRSTNQSAVLIIDRIGVVAPIVFETQQDNKVVYNDLERGVVHYPSTAMPGENGVSIILGHSSAYPWYRGKYGSIFALLGKLHAGDQIHIKYSDGRVLNYRVTASTLINPLAKDLNLTTAGDNRSTLLLISCWPVGTNYKRIAIEAVLQ